ncbi:17654_t:CDS:2 [Cetraspora pellucida]|uniref:17654_t:CDS:1 n=1 Tax=Cetraspora pellucida TaxID=1433469 RepID=A0A9N9JYE7_9GLOM|nr:17654_t:CDS:2 [Cetraspora pellucida]
MRNIHPIRTYFHDNSLKTRIICNRCNASYPIDTNLTNLKNHFFKHHRTEYDLAINEYEKNKKEIQKTNLLSKIPNATNIISAKHILDNTDYEIEETEEIESEGSQIKIDKDIILITGKCKIFFKL